MEHYLRYSNQKVIPIAKSNQVYIYRTCKVSGEIYGIAVEKDELQKWNNGMPAQDAFPNLSADEREFLISNTTPDEWERLFAENDEENE
jgi:hypothetical protein